MVPPDDLPRWPMPPAADTSVPKRAIAIRRASRPPAGAASGEGRMPPSRRTSGDRRGASRHRLSRAPQRAQKG